MMHSLFPTAKTQADRKFGAILIAVGIGIGISMDGPIFNHTGIGVFVGVLLGLAMYSVGMHLRLRR